MAGQQLTWLVTGCSSGLGEALVRAILDKVGFSLPEDIAIK